jgi:hypothetical protein
MRGRSTRRLRVAAAAAAACLLAWKIAAFAAADALAARAPEDALEIDGDHPTAAVFLIERRLAARPPDAAGAAAAATRLVARDPLAPGALSLLAAATSLGGDKPRAERMFRVAAAHLPIDLVAHGALYERALASRDAAAALAELDILLRARPFLAQKLAASIGRLLALGSDAETGLADLLASAPPWRRQLVYHLSETIRDPAALARIYGQLRGGGARPSDEEMRMLLERLVRDHDIDGAYLAWLDSLPPQRLSELGLLYNGQFQHPIANLPFDWQIAWVRGAAASVARIEGEGVLEVGFYDARVPFQHVRHLLTLPPGRYAFDGMESAENLENERGLRWRLSCLDDPNGALATTPPLRGAQPPRPFRMVFAVPAEGCGAQILVLELPARIASELQISGAARYWRLDIARLLPAPAVGPGGR